MSDSHYQTTAALITVITLSGIFAVLALVLSVRHIYLHLKHFSRPEYQLHIVRVLAMVPIYSLTSWFALILEDTKHTLILELIRDSYEAYVVYNFVVLLINYGGGDYHLSRYLEDQPRMPHPWPMNMYLQPLKLGPAFLSRIRASVLQFIFVKPTGSAIKLYLYFHRDQFLNSFAVVFVAIINNLSISSALYGLVLFYHAAHELLEPYRPFEKFISVKAVVFFSFWQGVVLRIAIGLGIIRDVEGFSATDQATGLQDFLICLEMAIAAICHYFVFSYTEYEQEEIEANENSSLKRSKQRALLHVVDFRDVLSDARDTWYYGGVGFESELREGQPIVHNVETVLDDTTKRQPKRKPDDVDHSSISEDLDASRWILRRPSNS